MSRKKRVKMGEYAIGTEDNVLSSLGIGSCVAVCLYDETSAIGGVAHVMLPDDERAPRKSADILTITLIEEMIDAGADPDALIAKLFGGATLLSTATSIGKDNIEAIRQVLSTYDIPVVAEDTGGDTGRSIWMNCRTGDVVVQKPFGPTERY